MNKKIKIMLVCLLAISCLSVFSPVKFSLFTAKAYAEAATYSLADRGELKSLDVQSTDGKSLELCDDYDGYKKDLTDEKTYYVTIDGKSDGLKIFAESAGDDYIVKVFESDRKYATPHDVGENISMVQGRSTIYIRTFTSQDALKRAVDNKDVTNCAKTYKINVNKLPTIEADDIYLEKLTLESGNIPINFDRDVLSYNVSVNDDVDEVEIRANPEDEDYTVKIGGFKVTKNDKYRKALHLKTGENEIKINITDDDARIRTYTLNITRGGAVANISSATDKTKSTDNNSNNNLVAKCNQWIQLNGKWQYNDSTGTSLKNIWFYDKNGGKNYYLQADGNMATGWLSNNGKWYYLGTDGAMKTGWELVNGTWYYLYSEGVMACNTKVDGYKLGPNGAWVK